MTGITPRQDAKLALLRYAYDVDSRATEESLIPGYPEERLAHLNDVAYYLRLAAAYVDTLPDITEDQSETSA